MRRIGPIAIALAMAAVLLAGTGCRRVPREHIDGKRADYVSSRDATSSVALGGAKRLRVLVAMGVGELRMGAAEDTSAIATSFEYGSESWRPEVEYDVTGATGDLTITQPHVRGPGAFPFRDLRNAWDLGLPPGVPTDLEIDLGAGESELVLGGLELESLRIAMGVGESRIDLTGTWSRDLTAEIDAGVGDITLYVPREAGVRVTGRNDGVGDYHADGMRIDGDAFVNDAYGTPGVPRLDIELRRGVGDVRIVAGD